MRLLPRTVQDHASLALVALPVVSTISQSLAPVSGVQGQITEPAGRSVKEATTSCCNRTPPGCRYSRRRTPEELPKNSLRTGLNRWPESD